MLRSLLLAILLGLAGRIHGGSAPASLHDGMLLVEASVSGCDRPLNLLVDSGAEETVICSRRVKKEGIQLSSRESIRTVNGTSSGWRTRPLKVSIGKHQILSKSLLVLDLKAESRALGVPIDGLLGADFFHKHPVRLAFTLKRLDWGSDARPKSGRPSVRLSRAHGAFFVEVQAADRQLTRVRLDTGCRYSLCWVPDGSGSVSRPWRNGSKKRIPLRLGSQSLPDISTNVFRSALIPGEDGLLGNGLLSRYDSVLIDAPSGRLTLENQWSAP